MKAAVVANGVFRVGRRFRALLGGAELVVACDGAADRLAAAGIVPDVVVGDLDSISQEALADFPGAVLREDEQETNDLSKALRFCRGRKAREVMVLGASGGREDHLIGNVFRLADFAGDFDKLAMATPHGIFAAFSRQISFDAGEAAQISVFTPFADAKMRSFGLRWPLDGVRFSSPAAATLNEATGGRVRIETDRPAIVYVAGLQMPAFNML